MDKKNKETEKMRCHKKSDKHQFGQGVMTTG